MNMLTITLENRKWWILAAMISSLSLVFLDQTAVVVALPRIQFELHLTNTMQQWIINAYMLMLASLIIVGGKAGDLYGHKRLFLVGIVIFSLSSLTCALAQSGWELIFSRASQGIGGALMVPATGVLVTSNFSESERGRAIGLYVGIASIFLSLGPFLGGFITEYLSWRWVFWLNLPIALFGFLMTLRAVPMSKVKPGVIDWIGAFTLLLMLFSLVTALMEGSSWGWGSHLILGLLILSVFSGIFFWRHEQNTPHPLVDFSIFQNVTFVRCTLTLAIMQSVFIVFIFWALFLQNILHLSPLIAGIFTIPVTLPIIFMSPIGGHLRDRYGPRPVIMTGIVGSAIAIAWVSIAAWLHNYWYLLPAFLLLGCSTPLVISSCMATAIPAVDFTKRGVGAGLINALRQIGSTLSFAVMTSLIGGIYHWHLSTLVKHHSAQLTGDNTQQILNSARSFSELIQLIKSLPEAQQRLIEQLNQTSYIMGFSMAMAVLVLVALVGLWTARKIPRKLPADLTN